jgi:hypothetical protein
MTRFHGPLGIQLCSCGSVPPLGMISSDFQPPFLGLYCWPYRLDALPQLPCWRWSPPTLDRLNRSPQSAQTPPRLLAPLLASLLALALALALAPAYSSSRLSWLRLLYTSALGSWHLALGSRLLRVSIADVSLDSSLVRSSGKHWCLRSFYTRIGTGSPCFTLG